MRVFAVVAAIVGTSPQILTAAHATDTQAPASSASKDIGTAVFLFGRANYFRVLTEKRNCAIFNRTLSDATNDRFEKARLRLVGRFGEQFFPANKPAGPIREAACDAATLSSYGNHIAEIEQFLNQSE